MTQPYFRFTKWLPKAEMLQEWFDFRKAQGVGVALVRRGGLYTLFVEGNELFSEGTEPNREKIEGVIVRACDPNKIFADFRKRYERKGGGNGDVHSKS